jgi:hypothetical protein
LPQRTSGECPSPASFLWAHWPPIIAFPVNPLAELPQNPHRLIHGFPQRPQTQCPFPASQPRLNQMARSSESLKSLIQHRLPESFRQPPGRRCQIQQLTGNRNTPAGRPNRISQPPGLIADVPICGRRWVSQFPLHLLEDGLSPPSGFEFSIRPGRVREQTGVVSEVAHFKS